MKTTGWNAIVQDSYTLHNQVRCLLYLITSNRNSMAPFTTHHSPLTVYLLPFTDQSRVRSLLVILCTVMISRANRRVTNTLLDTARFDQVERILQTVQAKNLERTRWFLQQSKTYTIYVVDDLTTIILVDFLMYNNFPSIEIVPFSQLTRNHQVVTVMRSCCCGSRNFVGCFTSNLRSLTSAIFNDVSRHLYTY